MAYTNRVFATGPAGTIDHSVMLKQGFMMTANDWRNVEMTGKCGRGQQIFVLTNIKYEFSL
jgi:hypothetical protein